MGLFCRAKSNIKKQKKEEEKVALQILLDFAEGRITTEEFWLILKENNKMRDMLINDKTRQKGYVSFDKERKIFNFNKKIPFDINSPFSPENIYNTIDIKNLGHRFELYLIVRAFFHRRKLKVCFYNEDMNKYLEYKQLLPDWVGINDITLIQKALDIIPADLTKKEKDKWCKQKIKELFKYDDKKPDWIQEPEWPIIDNIPYIFSHQETAEEGYEKYIFYNPKNREETIIIEQCE